MNLLQLVQQATAEMGLAVPTYVIGNTNQDVIQTLALTHAVGYELQREYSWQGLEREYRFTTQYTTQNGTLTNGSAVVTGLSDTSSLSNTYMAQGVGINTDTYVLTVDSATQVTLSQAATASGVQSLTFGQTKYLYPSDYDRPTDRTQWDKSQHWEMLGPETPQQWQWLKSSYISTGPRVRFRPLGNYFQIWPMLSVNHYLGFEYISQNWVMSATDIAPSQTSFLADTDSALFPARLMVLGIKLKYFEIKGFDTQALYRDFTMQKDIAKANDKGSAILSMAPNIADQLIGWENIPDSGYGS